MEIHMKILKVMAVLLAIVALVGCGTVPQGGMILESGSSTSIESVAQNAPESSFKADYKARKKVETLFVRNWLTGQCLVVVAHYTHGKIVPVDCDANNEAIEVAANTYVPREGDAERLETMIAMEQEFNEQHKGHNPESVEVVELTKRNNFNIDNVAYVKVKEGKLQKN